MKRNCNIKRRNVNPLESGVTYIMSKDGLNIHVMLINLISSAKAVVIDLESEIHYTVETIKLSLV